MILGGENRIGNTNSDMIQPNLLNEGELVLFSLEYTEPIPNSLFILFPDKTATHILI